MILLKKSLLGEQHQLLIHSITHESHHKGQIEPMLCLLGHIPKNTDILELPEREFVK